MNILKISKNVIKINNKIYKKYNLLIKSENERFHNEHKILRMLNKRKVKNIPKLLSVKIKNNIGYLIIKYIKGYTLADLMDKIYSKEIIYSENKLLILHIKIRKIIDNINRCTIIHRDIKPENIIIDKHDNVSIIDFGNACYWNESNKVSGTINYMCPNSLKLYLGFNDVNCNYKTDLWSLAILSYELFYKHHPFINKEFNNDYKNYEKEIINNILNFNTKEIDKVFYKNKLINFKLKKIFKEY